MANPFGTNNPGIGGLDELTSAEEAIIASVLPLGSSGQLLAVDGAGTSVEWVTAAGTGDMLVATYDPATVAEQLVGLTATQILTNKTLTSPVLTTPQINDTSADHQYVFAVSELTADRTVTLPLLTGNDTFVFNNFAAILTNKTIDTASNTITVVEADISDLQSYLLNVADDTTPQLGGSLDVNGNKIVSVSNGNIDIEPHGTGNVLLGNFTLDADQTVGAGQDNYVLTYDNGTGLISLEAAASAGLANVVEDTTPQLGGTLDMNSQTVQGSILPSADSTYNLGANGSSFQDIFVNRIAGPDGITFADQDNLNDELLTLVAVLSPVNYIQISNSATGNALPLTATGTDTNISINLVPKGSGEAQVAGEKIIDETDTASTTVAGISELATTAEVDTGTDTGRTVTPDALAGSYAGTKSVAVQLVEGATDTAVADGVAYFMVPASLNGMNLVSVRGGVVTAGTTGTTDIQIHNLTQTADMLTTKLTIDSAETTSATAATAAVIDTANDDVATNDVIRFDVDAVSTTAAQGLFVTLEFRLP